MGWKPVGFSEIEKFPSQVLAHHYPQVTNFGDMTKYKEWQINDPIGLLVGGTPCQSFSVAGLRKGLEDPRGNLALTYVGILDHFRPKWFIWENVPGVLSSGGGRDFGSFLGALGELGYGFAYRVLDAQYFGVPQRRRRVFVVGYLGDWRPPAEVLFESESLSRNFKPSRKTRQSVAGYVESSFGQYREDVIAGTTKASGGVLSGGSETFIVGALDTECGGQKLSHQSINSGHIFAVYENHPSDSRVKEMGEVCQTVTSTWGSGGGNIPFVQSFRKSRRAQSVNDFETWVDDGKSNTLNTFDLGDVRTTHAVAIQGNLIGRDAGGREGHLVQSIGFTQCDAARDVGQNISPTLRSGGDGGYPAHSVATNMAVRRLTPVECERLQGFPDNYTNIKQNCPDGARYKALGNSMAVPVMRWIGERINSYETMRSSAVVQVETGVGLAEV
jgi:DNA (cytosine-5)-methyltransferase 1